MKKQVTITISEEDKSFAKKQSKKILGKENLSGYIAYLINKEK
jgi:hypothetical protein